MLTAIGTSAAIVVPALAARLDLEPPAEEREALAHADEPEALGVLSAGSKPWPSSSITALTFRCVRVSRMLT